MRGQVGLRRSGSRFRVITFLVLFLTLYHCYGISPDGEVLLELKKSFGNNKDLLGLLRTWNKSDPDPCMWRGVECNSQQRVVTLNVSKGYASSNSCNEKDSNQNAASCAWFLKLVDQQGRVPQDQCKLRATPLDTLGSGYAVCLENRSNLNGTSGCAVSSKLPASISELSELRVLSLTNCGLSGEIPREVSKLRFLEVLDLHGNGFVGHVLPEIGNLKSLRVLDLGYNMLSGKIPDAICECGNLETLNLGGNVLNGSIPDVAIGNLIKLRYLNLGFNHISGPLTAELFKECHNLEHLHVASNLLIGEIPSELGNCPRLRTVLMFSNFIEGAIPAALGKLSMLETLDISRNSLSHEIPQELGNCKRLSVLILKDLVDYSSAKEEDYSDIDPSTGLSNSEKGEFNYFEGGIPASVVMLPLIKIIWSPRATLSGRLPEDWGECSSLEVLNLGQNEFSGRIPRGLRKCKKLFFLDLSNNHFKETLPQLSVPCLLVFNVSMNELSGNVPVPSDDNCSLRSSVQHSSAPVSVYSSFFLCSSSKSSPVAGFLVGGLTVLHDYSYNNFTGMIPAPKIADSILRDQPSYGLLLNGNQFFRKLPNTLFSDCQGFQSYGVNFSSNAVSGEISSGALGRCKSLRFLDASNNMITGTIPSSIGSLTNLEYVDMSNNGLQGSIPSEIQGLKDLKFLSLAGNKLSGSIVEGVGKITSLSHLDLSSNALTGDIPQDLVNLKQLKVLYLQQNKLSGHIPTGFASLNSLTSLNVSYNKLSGEIPTLKKELDCDSYEGNHFMPPCHSASSPSEQPEQMRGPLPDASAPLGTTNGKSKSFNTLEIAAVASASAVIFFLVIFVMILVYTRRHNAKSPSQRSGRKEVVTFNNIGVQLTYENVVRATGNFSVGHLIGHGGFGATYKAEITQGLIVAVKRLSVGKFHGIQQFDTEVRTLGRIKHPNLVTLIGYHGSESEMFLIYNYLPGGNLESFIHDNTDRNADWRILHKIALDIAKALAYLHDECVPRVLHRDIKPSNILLDNDLKAYLSDFGLARLLGASETHATTDVAGTFGYLAPEYAMTCRVSEKADVYSYGVVLLELLSGKKALDPSFSSYGNGFNIVAWGCMLLREGRAREFYTKGLWDSGPHDALIEALHLAVMCTVDSLSIRPLMRQVVDRLNGIQPHSST